MVDGYLRFLLQERSYQNTRPDAEIGLWSAQTRMINPFDLALAI